MGAVPPTGWKRFAPKTSSGTRERTPKCRGRTSRISEGSGPHPCCAGSAIFPGEKVTLDEPAVGDEAHLFPMDFMREGGAKRRRESAAFQSRELLADSIESLSFQSWEFARNYLMLHVRLSPWLGKKRCKIKAVLRT